MMSGVRPIPQWIATATLAVLAGLALGGCKSSPPTHFYTLTPVAPAARTAPANQAPVKVSAVHIPAVLDRNSMVRGEANYRLDISPQERWGADLGEMIRRTLTQNLQERLPEGMVIPARSPAPENARGLVVDFLCFGPDDSGDVKLDATWSLLEGSPAQVLLQRTTHLSERGKQRPHEPGPQNSASAAAQAAAMSALLGQLADDIANGVSQLREAQR